LSNTKERDDRSGQPPRKQQASLLKLRRRTKSARGATVLSALTVLFILLSYRTGNLLFEFDSIVSFLAALVLLFRDTSHSVQARVVNRILTSSRQLVADLSAYGLGGSSFLYVPEGRKVGDVMLVPQTGGEAPPAISSSDKAVGGIPAASVGPVNSASSQPSGNDAPGSESSESASSQSGGGTKDVQDDNPGSSDPATDGVKKAPTTTISNLKFAPPGRAMAELFLRESALKDPTMDDIIAAIPEAVVDGFQLADSSSVNVKSSSGGEVVEVTLVHPVLMSGCGALKSEGTGIVGCEVCSMLAVLFSSSTSRMVSLDGCTHDETSDSSTTSLRLGAKYPAD
jgi:hypothetical protein